MKYWVVNLAFAATMIRPRYLPDSIIAQLDSASEFSHGLDPLRTRPPLARMNFGLPRRQVFDPADNSTGCPCGVFK